MFFTKQVPIGTSLMMLLMLALFSCGQEGNTNNQVQDAVSSVQYDIYNETTDLAIIEAVYLDQRVPDDFYQDNPPGDAYYTTVNLKNTDLVPTADRAGMPGYELSTNDFSEALQWAESAAAYRPVYKQLTDTSETELYFQFTRVDLSVPQFVELFRVFKLSALDRTGIDWTNPDSYQGTIKLPSLSSVQVKNIIEYLWTFSYSNNYGTAVLKSEVTEYDTGFVHTLVEARLNDNLNQACDIIGIVEITYDVDKATGDIYKNENPVRDIYTQRENNTFSLCNGQAS